MKKRIKTQQDHIIVPVEWLSELVKRAELAEKDKSQIIHLIGYCSSAKILLKYGIRK